MTKRKAPCVNRSSAELLNEQIEKLKDLFPEAVSEGKVDFEKLKATLGEIVDDRSERYSFAWAGKRDAIRLLRMPSRATLKPCPRESVDWETTKNAFIEGDNLVVLKLLYKSYAGRIKLIYIDPPYNTGNDFIYTDNFTDPLDSYLMLTGQKDTKGNILVSNPETSGRFHSSWLSMMYPRLFLARQLLCEDGIIFVSIDDHELANLRTIMNEIFGEENSLPVLVWNRRHSQQQGLFKEYHEYIVGFAKSKDVLNPISGGEGEIIAGAMKKISRENPASDFTFPAGMRCEALDGTIFSGKWGGVETVELVYGVFEVKDNKLVHDVTLRAGWTQLNQMKSYFAGDEVIDSRGQRVLEFFFTKSGKLKYRKERSRITPSTILDSYGTQSQASAELAELFGGEVLMDYPKPTSLMRDLVRWMTDSKSGDIVLDFFAGSCSMAAGVKMVNREDGGNRRYICVQLPEPLDESKATGRAALKLGFQSIADIGKERIRRVIKRLKSETTNQQDIFRDGEVSEDLGFRVFKLAESNFRQWQGVDKRNGQKYAEEMDLFTDPLLNGWKIEDVVWEVALKEGYELSSTIEEVNLDSSNRVLRVMDLDREQTFHICLDGKLRAMTLNLLRLSREDLFIWRDIALTDEQAANLALICKLKTI